MIMGDLKYFWINESISVRILVMKDRRDSKDVERIRLSQVPTTFPASICMYTLFLDYKKGSVNYTGVFWS